MRRVPVHFHWFKNAGTSVDHLLRTNFAHHCEVDWIHPDFLTASSYELQLFLMQHRQIDAISTHTGMMGRGSGAEIELLPIVFMREPVARAYSAFSFMLRRGDTFGGRKIETFEDFVAFDSARPALYALRNSQTVRFCEWGMSERSLQPAYSLERAMGVADALPFVGCVEHFAESLEALAAYLAPVCRHFSFQQVQLNASAEKLTREEMLDKLSAAGRDRLLEENAADISLYDHVSARRYG